MAQPITAYMKLDQPLVPIKLGKANSPGATCAYLTVPKIPINNPAIPPPIIDEISGFLNFILTPYKAGSVIPAKAEIPVESPNSLVFLFLDWIPTASAAPP